MKNIIAILVLVGSFKAGGAITWTTPTGGSGTQSVPENQKLNTAIVTFVATPTMSNTLGDYTLLTTGTPFAVSTDGILTITTALDFETHTSHTLKIQVVDDSSASGTATFTVIVTDVNEAPAFDKTIYATTIADGSTADTTVFTATATDQDSDDKIAYSIAAGDTDSHFAIAPSTGVITVNTDVTLVACTSYALQIEAKDDDSTPLTGTATLNIEVTPCSGAIMIVVSTVMIIFAAFLTILQ